MYTLDFSLIFNNIIDNIDSLSEEELLEQLNLLYSHINLPDEIKASNKLKRIIYKTSKKFHVNHLIILVHNKLKIFRTKIFQNIYKNRQVHLKFFHFFP